MNRIKSLFPMVLFFLIACNAVSLVQARDSYQTGEILIVLRSGASIEAVHARFRTYVLDYIPETRLYRLALPEGTDVQATLFRMYQAQLIDGGEPNYISFSAPGVDIYSTYPKNDEAENDGFAWWSGTSFAAPLVAAQAALILEQFPNLRFSEMSDRMRDWYRLVHIDALNPGFRDGLGRGRIDLLLGAQ